MRRLLAAGVLLLAALCAGGTIAQDTGLERA